jgi:hypothetical protein
MSAYKSDILAQPSALQDTLDRLNSTAFPQDIRRGVQTGRWRKIVLTGMGSSYFGLLGCLLGWLRHPSCCIGRPSSPPTRW